MESTQNRLPLGRLLIPAALAVAGLTGIAVLAIVGWDIRHDRVILKLGADFSLTEKEWRSLARECVEYAAGAAAVVALCALWLRRRVGAPVWPTAARLAGSLVAGWIGAFYLLGRMVPLDSTLVELCWIAVAATAVGLFAYQAGSICVQGGRSERRPGPTTVENDRHRPARWAGTAAILVAAYIVTFGVISILRHNAFGTDLHDLGLYDQMLWNTLHGRPFRCTLWQITTGPGVAGGYDLKRFGYNFVAEHLMPILLVLAPIYALWQDPRNLLILQTLALGLAGIGLYRFAARLLASRALACLFVFAFLMNPLVQQTNVKDFHADAFEPLFFFVAVAALVERRAWLYWVSLVLLLSCKEDVSLTVMAFGLFLVWRERRGRLGRGTFALGAAWYAVGIHVVMAHFRGGEPLRQLYRYSHLVAGQRESVGAILKTLLLNPWYVAQIALEPGRVESVLRLFVPLAALPLFAPSTALFFLPPLASNLLSNWDTQYLLNLHYSIAILGPLYVAAVCGARNWLHPERANEPFFVAAGHGAGEGAADAHASPNQPRLAALVAFLLVAISLFGYRYGRFPGGGRFDADDLRMTDHRRLAYRYMAAIPADAAVSAHSPIGAHLTGRKTIYVFPELQDARWIVLDTRDHYWPFFSREAYEARVRELLQSGEWGVVGDYEDGFLILERGADASRNERVLARLDFKPIRR